MKTWRKAQKEMERHFTKLGVLLDYCMDQWQYDADERPVEVIEALYELYFPNRTFTVDEEGEAVDARTGETASWLFLKDRGLATPADAQTARRLYLKNTTIAVPAFGEPGGGLCASDFHDDGRLRSATPAK